MKIKAFISREPPRARRSSAWFLWQSNLHYSATDANKRPFLHINYFRIDCRRCDLPFINVAPVLYHPRELPFFITLSTLVHLQNAKWFLSLSDTDVFFGPQETATFLINGRCIERVFLFVGISICDVMSVPSRSLRPPPNLLTFPWTWSTHLTTGLEGPWKIYIHRLHPQPNSILSGDKETTMRKVLGKEWQPGRKKMFHLNPRT